LGAEIGGIYRVSVALFQYFGWFLAIKTTKFKSPTLVLQVQLSGFFRNKTSKSMIGPPHQLILIIYLGEISREYMYTGACLSVIEVIFTIQPSIVLFGGGKTTTPTHHSFILESSINKALTF